jgi:hypothetical protein
MIQRLKAGTGIEPVNSGFADRGLTTWLPRRILLQSRFAGFLLFLCCLSLPIVANFRELRKCQADNCASSRTTETGRTSTIWMASKSMTSESGSSLRTKPLPIGNSQNLPGSKEKRGKTVWVFLWISERDRQVGDRVLQRMFL